MANINAIIAQGGNVLGNVGQAQNIQNARSRNELLQLAIQNEPQRQELLQSQEGRLQAQGVRLQAAEDRAQSGFDTLEGLRQGITLMRFIDKDVPDIQGAIDFVSQGGVTEKEQPVIEMLQGDPAQIEALRTGTRGLIETALLVGDIKQGAVQETFRAATPDEFAELGPDVVGAQVSNTTGKLTNVQKRGAEGATAGGVRRQKIDDAIRLENLTEAQAVRLIDELSDTEINPVTGRVVTLDSIAAIRGQGDVVTEQPVGTRTATPEPAPENTLFNLARVATGPVSGATKKTAAVLSFFGVDTDEPATGAVQRFKTELQNLVRALSINPRFPVGEINRIIEEINIKPGFFKGTGVLEKQMISLDSSLQLRLQQAENDANDTTLPEETRQKAAASASSIRNFLPILGAPSDGDFEAELESLRAEKERLLGGG